MKLLCNKLFFASNYALQIHIFYFFILQSCFKYYSNILHVKHLFQLKLTKNNEIFSYIIFILMILFNKLTGKNQLNDFTIFRKFLIKKLQSNPLATPCSISMYFGQKLF